jgi:tyrosine-protein phosphatase YwqE
MSFFKNLFEHKRQVIAPNPIFECLGTDMHCHLIPNVDDGSKGVDETIVCLQAMRDAGFNKVICTPHFCYPRFPNVENDIKKLYLELKKDVEKASVEGLELIGCGGEYRIDSGFNDRVKGNHFLLVGGKYLLVELSLHQQLVGIEEILFDLQMKNHEIILAHPERYPYFSAQSPHYNRLKDMGIYFQVNILSLSGFYGEIPRRKAYEMIEAGMVEFLGTDTHNVLYAQALADATHDRRIEKLLEKHKFLNSQITMPDTATKKKF